MTQTLTVPAVKTVQKDHTLFLFSIDGKQLHQFAAVSQLARDEEGQVLGYQRPEVAAHIANIRQYIESDGAMLPNAIVLAFDTSVEFEPLNKKHPDLGTLTIPVPNGNGEAKPGFIVDGQQRSAAVRDAVVDSFPLCVVAFLASSEEEQREQFVLVNSAKPLPKSLIYELLPGMSDGASLPPAILKRKLAALLTQRLNADEDSPFRGLVKMPSNPDAIVQDNTLMKMVEASVADGALSDFKSEDSGFDVDAALALLKTFWRAVQKTFPDAWGLPPRLSRLSHAAGVLALGLVMDACVARHRERGLPSQKVFAEELAVLAPHCHWTDGSWNFGGGDKRPWNSIQSTPKDVTLLGDHMLSLYKKLVWKAKK
jgi:DGQHR domain-containing protein